MKNVATLLEQSVYLKVLFSSKKIYTVASWLVRSTPERVVRLRALAGDIVLCSWVTHFTPLHPGLKMSASKFNVGGGSRNTPGRFMLLKSE